MDFDLITNIGSNYEYFKSYLKNNKKIKKFNGKNNMSYSIAVYSRIIIMAPVIKNGC
jgi:hypothetical protein